MTTNLIPTKDTLITNPSCNGAQINTNYQGSLATDGDLTNSDQYENVFTGEYSEVQTEVIAAFNATETALGGIDAIKAEFLSLLDGIAAPLATYNEEIIAYVQSLDTFFSENEKTVNDMIDKLKLLAYAMVGSLLFRYVIQMFKNKKIILFLAKIQWMSTGVISVVVFLFGVSFASFVFANSDACNWVANLVASKDNYDDSVGGAKKLVALPSKLEAELNVCVWSDGDMDPFFDLKGYPQQVSSVVTGF